MQDKKNSILVIFIYLAAINMIVTKKHTLQPHGKNQTIPINLRNIHIIFGLIIITNSIMERLKLYII